MHRYRLYNFFIYAYSDINTRSEYRIKGCYSLLKIKVTNLMQNVYEGPLSALFFYRAFGCRLNSVCMCAAVNIKRASCPTVSSIQHIYLPPTPTWPYTCLAATGFFFAHMHTWNQVIRRNQINAENQIVYKPWINFNNQSVFLPTVCYIFWLRPAYEGLICLCNKSSYLHGKMGHLSL